MRFSPPTRRRWLQGLAAGCALAWPAARGWAREGATGSARQAPQVTIRLSHVVARQTPKGLALERFRENLRQASDGRIEVVIYPDSRLYGDADEVQALRLGAVDMLAPSLSKFGAMGFPEFELFDLPFLFETREQVHRVTQGPVGQALLAGLARQGLVGLGYLDNGFKHMSANRALLSPENFTGLRMRVQGSRVIAEQMLALGARPVVLAFGETRRALALGVVDGTENPVSNFWTQRMHEAQIDLSLTMHAWLGYAVVAHQRFWEHLRAEDRHLIGAALAEALAWGNTIAQRENDNALAALRKSGATRIHVLSGAQRQSLREATRVVYAGLDRRTGRWLEKMRSDQG